MSTGQFVSNIKKKIRFYISENY